MNKPIAKILILGSGPAGCSASIYAARALLEPVMVRGPQPGGQLTITTDVENYPGFSEIIQGPKLMQEMETQAEKAGTLILSDQINSVNLHEDIFSCIGESGKSYYAQTLIIATGAQAKWLGLETEKKFMGFGVSACATCDGFFYRGKIVCVIGGGNTACEEALYLTNICSQVILIHRRDEFKAEKILQNRVFNHPKIKIIRNAILQEIRGSGTPELVHGILWKDLKTGSVYDLSLSGVFIAIGHKPNTNLFLNQLEMDEEGYIITEPGSTHTNISGVFAAGDAQDKKYRQAITAAGTGCMAALDAEKHLSSLS